MVCVSSGLVLFCLVVCCLPLVIGLVMSYYLVLYGLCLLSFASHLLSLTCVFCAGVCVCILVYLYVYVYSRLYLCLMSMPSLRLCLCLSLLNDRGKQ